MRIVCLSKRWPHHTASGGYDRLAREIGATVVQRRGRAGLLDRAWRKLGRTIFGENLHLLEYSYEDLVAELRLLAKSWLRRPNVVHALYGDDQVDLLVRARRLLPCPLVASFHLPAFRLADRFECIRKYLVAGIDAAVVVSQCQLKDFQRWLGEDKVVYVPHGIDTRKFCEVDHDFQRRRVRMIMVGDHMRDWEAAHQIIDQCNARRLPVEFNVVIKQSLWPIFIGCGNTRLHCALPEEELIKLYQDADAALVPVLDATANNTILESLACGTPVISNLVGGIPEYVDDSCGWLFRKGEISGITDLIDQLCECPEIAWSGREAARQKSLEFSWDRVVEQMLIIYEALTRGDSPVDAVVDWKQGSGIALVQPPA